MKWFRLYDELVDDPKVQQLRDAQFKVLINLWCARCQHKGRVPPVDHLQFKLRMGMAKTRSVLNRLRELGLVDQFETNEDPHRWAAKWYRVYPGIVDDPAVQLLQARSFRRRFIETLNGIPTPFTRFVKVSRDRPMPPEWMALRQRVFERDDYTCRYCGERGGRLECDHVVPVIKGGSDDIDNLVTACFRCNRSKYGKTLEEWQHGRALAQILSNRLAV